jgi:hypothetical protein
MDLAHLEQVVEGAAALADLVVPQELVELVLEYMDWDFLEVLLQYPSPLVVGAGVLVVLVVMPPAPTALADQEFLIRLLELPLLIVLVVAHSHPLPHLVLPIGKVLSSFVIQHKKEKIICL